MPRFSSRSRSRSRFGGFRRRRGSLNWRKSEKPRMWQVGNFNIRLPVIFQVGANPQEFFATQLAAPGTFLPGTTADQRMLNTAVRRIEIGGIVWSQMVTVDEWNTDQSGQNWSFILQTLLTVNNVDVDGNAIGIDYPWGSNTPPIVNQPAAEIENRDEPVRILDRWGTVQNSHVSALPAGTARGIPIGLVNRSRSLRLRVPIKEDQSINWTFHGTQIGPGFVGTDLVQFNCDIMGTIYYRYRV